MSTPPAYAYGARIALDDFSFFTWYKNKVCVCVANYFYLLRFVCLVVLNRNMFSPFLFAVYLDGLLVELSKFGVHCH